MKFEWDPEKEKENIKKHKLTFKTASLVFNDENRLEFFDKFHSVYEDRYITLGLVGDVIMVVYTVRSDRYRIISARLATHEERRKYEDG